MKKFLSLIVVALMLVSILPLAAFAADELYPSVCEVENKTTSVSVLDTKTVLADGKTAQEWSDEIDKADTLEYELVLKGDAYASKNLYVLSKREAAVEKVAYWGNWYGKEMWIQCDVNSDTDKIPYILDANGNAVIKVRVLSAWAGDVNIAFSTFPYSTLSLDKNTWADMIDDSRVLKGIIKGEFTSAKVKELTIASDYNFPSNYKLANGIDAYEITATVKDSAGHLAKGQTVNFSIISGFGKLSATSAVTDASGVAKVKVTSTKPGKGINIKATCGGETATDGENKYTTVQFRSVGVVTLVADEDSQDQTFDLNHSDNGTPSSLTFKVTGKDVFGNENDFSYGEVVGAGPIQKVLNWELSTKPATSKKKDGDIAVSYKANYFLDKFTFTPDVEGDYVIKFYLNNASTVAYKFTAKKFNKADFTSLTLDYGVEYLAADGVIYNPTVKAVTADGFKVTLSDSLNNAFTTSDASLAAVYSVDKDGDKGAVYALEKEGTFTVSVFNTDFGLSASQTITIVKKGTALKVTAPVSTAAGDAASVTLQLVNADGQPVANGHDLVAENFKVYVLSAPDKDLVSEAVLDGDANKFATKGEAKFDVTSYVKGTVKLQVIATTSVGTYSGTVDVVFGDVTQNVGVNDIVFMVGANSYVANGVSKSAATAPYVDANGRTMLGLRDLGNAMGASVKYADGVATLVKGVTTVTVKAGEKQITVNGNAVAIDTEAVVKNERIFLPFRAVLTAFGYTVSYANGVITCR